jgi:phosphatidylethanolamine/phosphatidyl-N-methylethanolamine N-methyltransferase
MTTTSATSRGLYFFRRFLRNPREVRALLPSTRHLGEAMVRGLMLQPGDVVVEYGPGTGALTQAIAAWASRVPKVRYLGIERERGFCEILRQRFPQFEFANAQVEDVQQLLAERGMQAPRAILSGLPLILLPTMREIVRTAEAVLQPGCEFRTFSYLQSYPTPAAGRLRTLMRETFEQFSMSRLVLKNFPPAFVLRGTKAALVTASD